MKLKLSCAGCRALAGAYWNPCTGRYRVIRKAECILGHRTDGAMHPLEPCGKPRTRREFGEMLEKLRKEEG